MKKLLKNGLLRSGLLRVVGNWRGATNGAAILMYHSVMDDPNSGEEFLGEIIHSRTVFQQQMQLLARKYQPVGLDDVLRFLSGGGELPARSVAVTFDDGYLDNYEIAAPVLNETGIPAAFYTTIECVEHRMLPWPARLRYVLRNTKKCVWHDSSGRAWPLETNYEREQALLRSCEECCQLTGAAQRDYVSAVENTLDTQVPQGSGSLMMDYAQMRSLVRQGHKVGSHTLTHPNMAYVDSNTARRELVESKTRLEHGLQSPVTDFAYPCPALTPHWTEQTCATSREAGYLTAVTTNPGLARKGDDPQQLKRIGAPKSVEGLEWDLESVFAGRLG